MTKRILRLPEVIARTGLSRSTIYAFIDAGKFPDRVKLGPRMVGWFEDEIDQWIDLRKAN